MDSDTVTHVLLGVGVIANSLGLMVLALAGLDRTLRR